MQAGHSSLQPGLVQHTDQLDSHHPHLSHLLPQLKQQHLQHYKQSYMQLPNLLMLPCRQGTAPFSQASYSTQTSSTPTSATSYPSTSSSNFDTPCGATHRRRHSHGTPSHGHKVSNGSLNFNNLDLIAPSVPHAHMVFTAPVTQQRVHAEPLSDLLFSQYALYTADACGQVSVYLD